LTLNIYTEADEHHYNNFLYWWSGERSERPSRKHRFNLPNYKHLLTLYLWKFNPDDAYVPS